MKKKPGKIIEKGGGNSNFGGPSRSCFFYVFKKFPLKLNPLKTQPTRRLFSYILFHRMIFLYTNDIYFFLAVFYICLIIVNELNISI